MSVDRTAAVDEKMKGGWAEGGMQLEPRPRSKFHSRSRAYTIKSLARAAPGGKVCYRVEDIISYINSTTRKILKGSKCLGVREARLQ